MLAEQFEAIRASVDRLGKRGIALPADDLLLFRMLVTIGRSLNQLAETAVRPFGLAEPEFRVLVELYSRPDGAAHPGELCAGASQSPASVSRITDCLVGRGLVTRSHSDRDRRRMVLQLTPAGGAIVRSALPAACEQVRALFACGGDRPGEPLLEELARIAAAVDAAAPAVAAVASGEVR